MGLQAYLILAAVVFCIGLFGVVTRRNTIGILLGIELMLNAVNINLVAFSRFSGDVTGHDLHGLHDLHHRDRGRARPGDRHSAVPRPAHRDGGPPRPAEGMMTDAGLLAARRAAAPRAVIPGAGDRRLRCGGSAGPRRAFSILCAAGSLVAARASRGSARRGHRLAAGLDWLPSRRPDARHRRRAGRRRVDDHARAGRARRVPRPALFARLPAATSRPRRSAATTPTSRSSRSR